jgi:cytochrome P450
MKLSDFSSSEFYENPYPFYERVRAAGPLVYMGPTVAMTASYTLTEALLPDRRMAKQLMASVRGRYGESATREPVFEAFGRMFASMNPPEHTRLRALLTKAFTAKSLESIERVSEGVANRLIDSFKGAADIDLVESFATPFPIEIICHLLDLPLGDGLTLSEAASTMLDALDVAPLTALRLERANQATLQLRAYFRTVVQARRTKAGDDLISALVAAQAAGHALTDEEVISNAMLLFIAGHETTTSMISNALFALGRHPDQLAMLKSDFSLMSRAIDECMRLETSVQAVTRVALESVVIDGIHISEGTIVFMLLGGANRDPVRFCLPNQLDIHRADAGKLSFGGGIHYCIGARLAHMQLAIALRLILTRMPELQLDRLDTVLWKQRGNLRSIGEFRVKAGRIR